MAFGTTDPKQEEALIARAIKGDGAAFTELMSLHETRMYAVALRMCANREDAQDCLQDAMLRVYRSISGFKGQSTFATWVYRITMNTCLDELRRRKTRAATSLDTLLDSGWSPADEGDVPERHAVASEQRRVLDAAIAELPEDMRSAVVLRDIQGCAGLQLRRNFRHAGSERGHHQISHQPGQRKIAPDFAGKFGTF